MRVILVFVDKVVVGKNIFDSKLAFCMFYVTVHRFFPRVQSSTCTTYGNILLESIMAVLTKKSGMRYSVGLRPKLCGIFLYKLVVSNGTNLQSRTKYLAQNGVIQKNWTGKWKFGICFCMFFSCYSQSLRSWRETSH